MKTLVATDGYEDMTLAQATSLLWYCSLGGDWHLVPPGELAQALRLERAAHIAVNLMAGVSR